MVHVDITHCCMTESPLLHSIASHLKAVGVIQTATALVGKPRWVLIVVHVNMFTLGANTNLTHVA